MTDEQIVKGKYPEAHCKRFLIGVLDLWRIYGTVGGGYIGFSYFSEQQAWQSAAKTITDEKGE